MAKPRLSDDGRTVTVRVPISIRKRGGRKLVLAPDGVEISTKISRRVDSALVKAIARAFRWRDLLETGTHATMADIATSEKINQSYVSRLFRLTHLAPAIIQSILNGQQPDELTLSVVMKPFPVEWTAQFHFFRFR